MASNSLQTRIVARLLWLAFGAGWGAYELLQAMAAHSRPQTLLGIGLILLGLGWFLQPPSLTSQVGQLDAKSRASSVGPVALRLALALGGLACMLAALYLHAVSRGWIS